MKLLRVVLAASMLSISGGTAVQAQQCDTVERCARLALAIARVNRYRLERLDDRLDAMEAAVRRGVLISPTACDRLGQGWFEFDGGAGRFLLGAGGGYETGTIGGAAEVTLSAEQMPAHAHVVPHKGADIGVDWLRPGGALGVTETMSQENTSAVGGSEPHDNMPPYRVVHFCMYAG